MAKNFILFFSLLIAISSCQKEQKNMLQLSGEIKGMTKGMLFLEKVRDTNIVLVDTFSIKSDGIFHMQDSLYSPEIYYLSLREYPSERILIFAEPSEITLKTKIEKFTTDVKIEGSENHDLWVTYNKMIQNFNNERLELIKEEFNAKKDKNQNKLDSLHLVFKKHLKRKYLFATNYAVNHADKEIAPYIALTDLYDAQKVLLDTIQNSMTSEVKASFYGKKFETFLKSIENQEALLKQ